MSKRRYRRHGKIDEDADESKHADEEPVEAEEDDEGDECRAGVW